MILVVGGASESGIICRELAAAGHKIIITTSTDIPMDLDHDDRITRKTGALGKSEIIELVRDQKVRAIVDIGHPYAIEIKRNAKEAARSCGVAFFSWSRPATDILGFNVIEAQDHLQASKLAFDYKVSVLATIGTRNIKVYAEVSKSTGIPLFARVLPSPESVRACEDAGVSRERIIAERGPFSVERNVKIIRDHGIGVMVTKDGGKPGGTTEKLRAAQITGISTVMVRRPDAVEIGDSTDLGIFIKNIIEHLESGDDRI